MKLTITQLVASNNVEAAAKSQRGVFNGDTAFEIMEISPPGERAAKPGTETLAATTPKSGIVGVCVDFAGRIHDTLIPLFFIMNFQFSPNIQGKEQGKVIQLLPLGMLPPTVLLYKWHVLLCFS